MKTFRAYTIFLFSGLASLLLLQFCQSPVAHAPEVEHRVLVRVQDEHLKPLHGVPVEVHAGNEPGSETLLDLRSTDARGETSSGTSEPAAS